MSLYYKYTTLVAANNFCTTVNTGEKIPVSQNSVTQFYCKPIENTGNYYVISDQITSKYTAATPVELPPSTITI